MALDFPTNPALNEIYTYGGRSWQWNGTAWDVYNASSGLTQYVSKLNGLCGSINIAAGTSISVTPTGNTLTIAYTGTGGAVTGVSSFNGLTGAVTGVNSIRGLTGTIGITNGSGITLSVSGQTLTISHLLTNEDTDATRYIGFYGSTSGTDTPRTDIGLIYNPFTQTISGMGGLVLSGISSGGIASSNSISLYDPNISNMIITSSTGNVNFTTPTAFAGDVASISLLSQDGLENGFTAKIVPQAYYSGARTFTLPDDSGTVALTKNVVSSFNGLTGAVKGVTTGTANTFVALQSFSSGISAAGGVTFSGNVAMTSTSSHTGLASFAGGISAAGGTFANNFSTLGSFNALNGGTFGSGTTFISIINKPSSAYGSGNGGGIWVRDGAIQIGGGSFQSGQGFWSVNPDSELMFFSGRQEMYINQGYQAAQNALSIAIGLTHTGNAIRIAKQSTTGSIDATKLIAGCDSNGIWYGVGFSGGTGGIISSGGFTFGNLSGTTFMVFVPQTSCSNGGLWIRDGNFQIGGSVFNASGNLVFSPCAERFSVYGYGFFNNSYNYQAGNVPLRLNGGPAQSVPLFAAYKQTVEGTQLTGTFTTTNMVSGIDQNGALFSTAGVCASGGITFTNNVQANGYILTSNARSWFI